MQRALPLFIFVVVLGAARIIGASNASEALGNLQPFGALFFCGMALFGWRGITIPAIAWLVTYPITSLIQGYEWSFQMAVPIIGFAAMIAFASIFKNAKFSRLFLGSLTSAVVFYLITNSLCWLLAPEYSPKTSATFIQALWTGLPQYSPTWLFFRNDLIAQGLFSGIYLLATTTLPALYRGSAVQPKAAQ